MQPAIAAMSLEHTSAVFIRANLDIWEVSAACAVHTGASQRRLTQLPPSQEINEFIPRFNSDPGKMHAPDGNPNVYIDPSKKLTMYAHVTSSDTVLQRYNIVGLPTVRASLDALSHA